MFVLVVIAVTAAITNGACPEADSRGVVACFDEELATIPQLPVEATEVQVGSMELLVCTQE